MRNGQTETRKRCVKCVLENESDYGRFGGLGVCGRVETRCFWDFLGLELSIVNGK